MESVTEEVGVELLRKMSSEVLESIMTQVTAEPDHQSRIPVPVPRTSVEALLDKERLALEVPLEGKATVTLIDSSVNQASVISLMCAENSELNASESFTMVVESKQEKGEETNSTGRQLGSVSQIKSSSRASSAKTRESTTSLATSIQSKHPQMKLPHELGTIPSYLRNRSTAVKKPESKAEPLESKFVMSSSSTLSQLSTALATESPSPTSVKKPAGKKPQTAITANILSASNTQSRLSTAPTPMSTAMKTETLKKSNEQLGIQTVRLKKQVTELTKQLDESSKKLKEAETALVAKDNQLKDKINRIRDLEGQKARFQRETKKTTEDTEKIASLESQLATLKQEKEKLLTKVAQKEFQIEKQRTENHRLEKELKKTLDLNDQILAASEKQESGDGNAQEKYENVIKELKKQLKLRDSEISNLKRDSLSLNEENRSLKTQSLELVKVKAGSELAHESFQQKKSEEAQKQEINKLKSMLEDATHKNFRNENLLQLRGEYIKTLQETDEINKSRLLLQIKDNDDLKIKVEKLRKFKAACNEELNNMKNTLINQERDIQQLKQVVEFKDEQIQMLKQMKNRPQ